MEKDLNEQLVCCLQQSHRCSQSRAGNEAAQDAPLGPGDLNPAFIIGLGTTATVGQLFFIKKKEAAQHPSRSTLSMTSSFIPSSCLPLWIFPAASETKDRIWMWNGFNITVEIWGEVRIPSLLQDSWRPSAACFSPAPQQSSTETRDSGMQCDNLLMTGLMFNLSCVRSQDGEGYWPSLRNFIPFQQRSFRSPSSLVGQPTETSPHHCWRDEPKSPKLWPYT